MSAISPAAPNVDGEYEEPSIYDESRVVTRSQANDSPYTNQRQLPPVPGDYDEIDPYQSLFGPDNPHKYEVITSDSPDLPAPS